jgi:hypothetical protein
MSVFRYGQLAGHLLGCPEWQDRANDVDATIALARRHGATIVFGLEDIERDE